MFCKSFIAANTHLRFLTGVIFGLQILHYYLVDDTVEIREVHAPNDGHDPFPVLICRQKLPKCRTKVECKSLTNDVTVLCI